MLTLAFLIVLYFLPAIIGRNKHDAAGIFLLNLFLGWTFIGWLIALIWACAGEQFVPARLVPVAAGPARYYCQCGTLAYSGAHYCAGCGRAV